MKRIFDERQERKYDAGVGIAHEVSGAQDRHRKLVLRELDLMLYQIAQPKSLSILPALNCVLAGRCRLRTLIGR